MSDIQSEIQFWRNYQMAADKRALGELPRYTLTLNKRQMALWYNHRLYNVRYTPGQAWGGYDEPELYIPPKFGTPDTLASLYRVSINHLICGYGLTAREAYRSACSNTRLSLAHNYQKRDKRGQVIGGQIMYHWSFVNGKIEYRD